MNSADSSSLIDSPAASRFGGHRALLYMRELGTVEKLRPYGVPSAEWLAAVGSRFGQVPKAEPGTRSSAASGAKTARRTFRGRRRPARLVPAG